MTETEPLQVEATGETVGEAKWSALRELEKLQPGIDKAAVQFQVVSEGERGLLGVGYAPARVIASVDRSAVAAAAPSAAAEEEGDSPQRCARCSSGCSRRSASPPESRFARTKSRSSRRLPGVSSGS